MDVAALLADLFGRIPPIARDVVHGLEMEELLEPPAVGANPIGWLLWHIGRVQDAQIPPAAFDEQLWVMDGWAERFGLPAEPTDVGYGHSQAQVAAVRPESSGLLLGYLDAVHQRTMVYVAALSPGELDRVIDERWDPPVTLGVRLNSVVADCLQHVGQASYLRGLLDR
jgi:hypothetical protein